MALIVEEIEASKENSYNAMWVAELAKTGRGTMAMGISHRCATAIILAIIGDLISNSNASWKIDVRD